MVIGRYFVVPGSGPASGSARLLPKLRFQRSFGHATGIALFRFDRLVRRVRILEQEREHVGSLFDALRDGFAGAVARLGVDADQDRSVAALGVLHLGGELERMSRHDTVIVVGSRYQRRRILRALLDVMQRGVFVEVAELLLVVARAVLYDPAPADGELVVAEHVHHAHGGQADGIEVGTLHLAGADQQAAVRTARNGELVRRSVFFGDQVLGRGRACVLSVSYRCSLSVSPRRPRGPPPCAVISS